MLCYKCTHGVAKVKNLKSTNKTLTFNDIGAIEDHDQDVYGALEKNMNLKQQIKQKLRKDIGEKAETNTMKQCKALAEANKIWMNEHEVKTRRGRPR